MMAKTLWLVSLGAQEEEIKKWCFGDCGKVLIGGIDLMGGVFIPCKTPGCDHVEKSLNMGAYIVPLEGERELVVRRLVGVDADEVMPVTEQLSLTFMEMSEDG